MPASEQARLALESLRFELMGIGFNFVTEESRADALVDFYIGTIRHDPIAGWIADQAFVKFKDRRTGEVLAFFRANTRFITPTTNNIISKLAKSVRKSY